MIFLGVTMKEVAIIPMPQYTCPNCGANHTIELHVVSKYFMAFGFNTFPFETVCVAGCIQCEHTMLKQEAPAAMKEEIGRHNAMYKPKGWQLAGVAIIVFLICMMAVMSFY